MATFNASDYRRDFGFFKSRRATGSQNRQSQHCAETVTPSSIEGRFAGLSVLVSCRVNRRSGLTLSVLIVTDSATFRFWISGTCPGDGTGVDGSLRQQRLTHLPSGELGIFHPLLFCVQILFIDLSSKAEPTPEATVYGKARDSRKRQNS